MSMHKGKSRLIIFMSTGFGENRLIWCATTFFTDPRAAFDSKQLIIPLI